MNFKNWTPGTQFVLPEYAEQVRHTHESHSYTLEDLMWLTHWMSTDGNWQDEECVNGYKECLTPEGWIAFLAALTNACAMEGIKFPSAKYATHVNGPYNWFVIREHVLGMQCHGELYDKLIKEIKEFNE